MARFAVFSVFLFGEPCLPAGGVEGALRSVQSCHERPKSLLTVRPSTTFPSKTE
ncbi:hypothetical protein E2C01_040035 [Portunus trituberculatus]|uniref:Uncharacterized protein n=1 Tax=Portunus trituberculatus TaxID=210409 RepID=A0A5B7FMW5_PORTR|nr:hypothetical protein [Portunus trituberculatus]